MHVSCDGIRMQALWTTIKFKIFDFTNGYKMQLKKIKILKLIRQILFNSHVNWDLDSNKERNGVECNSDEQYSKRNCVLCP